MPRRLQRMDIGQVDDPLVQRVSAATGFSTMTRSLPGRGTRRCRRLAAWRSTTRAVAGKAAARRGSASAMACGRECSARGGQRITLGSRSPIMGVQRHDATRERPGPGQEGVTRRLRLLRPSCRSPSAAKRSRDSSGPRKLPRGDRNRQRDDPPAFVPHGKGRDVERVVVQRVHRQRQSPAARPDHDRRAPVNWPPPRSRRPPHRRVACDRTACDQPPAPADRPGRIAFPTDQPVIGDGRPHRSARTVAGRTGAQVEHAARRVAGKDRGRAAAHIVAALDHQVGADELVDIGPGQGVVLHRQAVLLHRDRLIPVERNAAHPEWCWRPPRPRYRPTGAAGRIASPPGCAADGGPTRPHRCGTRNSCAPLALHPIPRRPLTITSGPVIGSSGGGVAAARGRVAAASARWRARRYRPRCGGTTDRRAHTIWQARSTGASFPQRGRAAPGQIAGRATSASPA